jgi:hypothetical protein
LKTRHPKGSPQRLSKEDKGRKKKRQKIYSTVDPICRQLHGELWTDQSDNINIPTQLPTLVIMKIISWNILGLNGRSKQLLV